MAANCETAARWSKEDGIVSAALNLVYDTVGNRVVEHIVFGLSKLDVNCIYAVPLLLEHVSKAAWSRACAREKDKDG